MESTAPKVPGYAGLLGLDRLPALAKLANWAATIGLGTLLALFSWRHHLGREVYYQWHPLNWPLLLLFTWPLCAAVIWLRLTGLRWRWALLAAALICVGYAVLSGLLQIWGSFIS